MDAGVFFLEIKCVELIIRVFICNLYKIKLFRVFRISIGLFLKKYLLIFKKYLKVICIFIIVC